MEYLKAAAPKMAFLAVLLALASFKTNGTAGVLYIATVLLTVFTLVSGTLNLDNYMDREADHQRGRDLAYKNPKRFLRCTIGTWVIAGTSVIVLMWFGLKPFLLGLFIALSGLLYNQTRRIFMASNITVAILSAAVTFFPICRGIGPRVGHVVLLGAGTFLFTLAREILKDAGDLEEDIGNKATLATHYLVRPPFRFHSIAPSLSLTEWLRADSSLCYQERFLLELTGCVPEEFPRRIALLRSSGIAAGRILGVVAIYGIGLLCRPQFFSSTASMVIMSLAAVAGSWAGAISPGKTSKLLRSWAIRLMDGGALLILLTLLANGKL